MSRFLPVWLLFVSCLALSSRGSEVSEVRTNFTDRFITNLVEVRMPRNIFIASYHTNFVETYRTNFIDVELPKEVRVEKFRTNIVQLFHTNVSLVRITNLVEFNKVQTNYVGVTRTNLQTLFFTNYQEVLVMRTNRVTIPVTTITSVRAPAIQNAATNAQVLRPAPVAKPAGSEFLTSPPAPILSENYRIEVYPPSRQTPDGHYTVELKVRSLLESGRLIVEQWKVEREDGAVLCFAMERDFKRELLPGHYRVEVLIRERTHAPLLASRASLTVGPAGIEVDSKHVASN